MKKILIIEDDIFLGDVLLKKMRNSGYTASLAQDGAQGLKDMKSIHPDLVIMDVVLPTMSGYDVLEEKFKSPNISRIPVIVISNSGQSVEVDKLLALGVRDYLIKAQFDPEEVLEKVKLQLQEGSSVSKKAEAGEAVGTGPKLGTLISGKKILWVEDDVFLGDIISRKLSTQGCKLIHEVEGEAALKSMEAEMPDIILLDILLSGIDGFEILKRLKQNPKINKIPVIMLSNLGQASDIERAKSLGANRFLIKATVTLDEIIDEIKDTLEKKK